MDNQQPNVRRRLSFSDSDEEMRDASMLPREGGQRDIALPGNVGIEECDTEIDLGETDEESLSGEEEGDEEAGIRLLYEGLGRPTRINMPHEGFAIVLGRLEGGITRMVRLPIGRLHIAMPRRENNQTQRDTPRNENNDRQREV